MNTRRTVTGQRGQTGKLRIGNDWNAITIIALSQNNPLKAVAEFVENSIDAGAQHITITRGKERGETYLRVADDGDGLPRDEQGNPDFKYVATHICDSLKRQLKENGAEGIQGEFGIGLLSFWTVGEELTLTSAAADGRGYQMQMRKGEPGYTVHQKRTLFSEQGTQLTVKPLLPGIRQFSGEKIQWFLASELRDRIRQSGAQIKVVDRHARKEYKVEPRQFGGRLLHRLPTAATSRGELYLELYLTEPTPDSRVGLYRSGTRVLADLTQLDTFHQEPWNTGYLQGIIDAPFLNLTPGTRTGVIHDYAFADFCAALKEVEKNLLSIIKEQKKAEEDRTSREMLRAIQRAFKEALLALPTEEYNWFDVRTKGHEQVRRAAPGPPGVQVAEAKTGAEPDEGDGSEPAQRQFFEYAGPLSNVRISPASCVVSVRQTRNFRAVPRDRVRHLVEQELEFRWNVAAGGGTLTNTSGEIVTYTAPEEPGLARIHVVVTQGLVTCQAEAMVTVTDSLLPEREESSAPKQGLPSYTFERAPGQLWRSKYDADHNVIVINNGHRDFVYASRSKALKLRYMARLYAKEMVCRNFPGYPPDQLLERLIELSLYAEESLK
jgi:hypothetical protein